MDRYCRHSRAIVVWCAFALSANDALGRRSLIRNLRKGILPDRERIRPKERKFITEHSEHDLDKIGIYSGSLNETIILRNGKVVGCVVDMLTRSTGVIDRSQIDIHGHCFPFTRPKMLRNGNIFATVRGKRTGKATHQVFLPPNNFNPAYTTSPKRNFYCIDLLPIYEGLDIVAIQSLPSKNFYHCVEFDVEPSVPTDVIYFIWNIARGIPGSE